MAYSDMQYTILYQCWDARGLGWIDEAGIVNASQGIPDLRRLRQWQVSYVTRGSGWLITDDNRRFRIQPGTWYCLFPDRAHTYVPDPGTTWDEIFCMFGGALAALLQTHGHLDSDRPLRTAYPIAHWHQRLLAIFETAETCSAATLALHLATIISEMDTAEREPGDWLAGAKALLENPRKQTLSLTHIAKKCGLSAEAFRKRFTRQAGITPQQFHERCRLTRACELLTTPALTLQKVAEQSGFADAFHLSRRFKAVLGVSPRDWRRQLPR